MRQLGETGDPRELVPGNPGEVRRTADIMARFGSALSSAGEGLRRIDDGGWKGPAADGFHEAFDGEPKRWIECGDAFGDAAGALTSYASTHEWAQGQAAEAIVLWDQGEAATNAAKADHEAAVQRAHQDAMALTAAGVPTVPPEIPFHDPGEEKRQAARDKLQRARHQLDEAGDRAEVTVGHARDKAPPKPKWWQKVGEFLSEFGKGAWEATVGLVEFAWSISTVRMLVDPVGYAQTVASYVQAAQFAVQHPGDFAKAVVDWDTWKQNPARAIGHLVPDIALAVATGGAGAAASRGGSAAAKAARLAKAAVKPGKARFGHTNNFNYRDTFFNHHPDLNGKVVVHHAVEQQALKRYPDSVNPNQIHSYENLRGIPKGDVNNQVHLSDIRKEWNRFYREHPTATQGQLLDFATKIDDKFGSLFKPPVR